MDARQFDHLARTLTMPGRRRDLLALLAALPLLGGLATLLEEDEAGAKRRKRGKQAKPGRRLDAEKKRKKKKKKKKNKKTPRLPPPPPPCAAESPATTCAGTCGPVQNACQQTVDCGPCACDPACDVCFTCQGGPNPPAACVADPGLAGDACGACATCDGSGRCVGCAAGLDCCGNGCFDLQSDPDHCGACGRACGPGETCQEGVRGFVCDGDFCPAATEICDNGSCQACDVCATCGHQTIQDALNELVSGVIRICAGVYRRAGTAPVVDILFDDFALVGAGAESTILDGEEISSHSPVLDMRGSVSTLRQLTITGSNGAPGIVTVAPNQLVLTDVIVSENVSPFGAGILNEGLLTLNAGTIVRDNVAIETHGGGIANGGEQALLSLNAGARVTGNAAAFFGGGIYNIGGTVILQAGSEVSHNDAFSGVGGIENVLDVDGTVTLHLGSLVCGNDSPQCRGFNDPNEICQDTCP